jgi:TrkA family protein
MNLLRWSNRTFSLTLDGAREAVVAVAERVAMRVHVGKLELMIEDAETRLQQAYEALGQYLYNIRHAPSEEGASLDTTLPLSTRIRQKQQVLQALRDRLASQLEDQLIMPLSRLQEDLQQGGGTVERVTIAPGTQADGRRLGDLPLPETVRLIALRRGETLLIPSGSLVFRAGDEITILGSRSSVLDAHKILRT